MVCSAAVIEDPLVLVNRSLTFYKIKINKYKILAGKPLNITAL
jgi:hypothetical protein